MDDRPKAWRVNRSPRLSAAEFGEYMAADDGPRETILRDAKYERLARTLLYRDVQQAVAQYIASHTRDRRILRDCRTALEGKLLAASDPTRRNNLAYELQALDKFESALNELGIAGVTGALVSNRNTAMRMEGVSISIRPTAWLTQARMRSADRVGAVLIDFAKGQPLRTELAEEKARNAMEHIACLLHLKTQQDRCDNGEKAHNELCFLYHLHRGQLIAAPVNYARKVKNMEAVCRVVANAWDGIQPPSSFDPNDATYRS